MKTAVIISLHYETQSFVTCRALWTTLCERMSDAGFSRNGNRFITTNTRDFDTAGRLARSVLEGIESEYCARNQSAWEYIRDFYAVPESAIVDLAGPTAHAIEVDLMATGAFQTFFP
jgi:hypothetical protein